MRFWVEFVIVFVDFECGINGLFGAICNDLLCVNCGANLGGTKYSLALG